MSNTPVRFPKHLKPIEPQGADLLEQERQRSTFSSKELTTFIYGPQYLESRNRILSILEKDPILSDKSHRYYKGRDYRFKKSLEAANRLAELEQ
jgi:acyl-CoA oxidase